MNLSIIIPAYNEARRLGVTLEAIAGRAAQSELYASYEVIVVCDGCRDATEQVARSFCGRLPMRIVAYPKNRGKGYAVRAGVALSSGRLVAFMDADGATPVQEMELLAAPLLSSQASIVIGSRRVPGAHLVAPQAFHRRWLGRLFALHARLVLGLAVRDTQCGFKVFQGTVARELFSKVRCDGFAFDLELLALARVYGLRVQEIGVTWREQAGSTVRPLRDGLRMVCSAWRIRGRMRGMAACSPETFLPPRYGFTKVPFL